MRFFIMCLANCVTGGTELLHQLSWHLSNRGVENYMLYMNVTPGFSPTADVFEKYEVTPITYFVDDTSSVLVLPETMLDAIDICRKGTTIIWWLSADNYIKQYNSRICQEGKIDIFGLNKKDNLVHFVQSRYAKDFIEKQFDVEDVSYLKDYINDDVIRIASQYKKKTPRENICLYNPKKGLDNLEYIRNRCREDITWIPLTGLNPDQLARIMCMAKVYIDFGNHPGKDRIPREAAVCGCCIITNRKGSAAYAEDVGIPEKYKLSDMLNYDKALDTIYDLIDNYNEKVGEYEEYVISILREKEEFNREVDDMLEIISKKCICTTPPWKRDKYDEIWKSIQKLISQINSKYENAKELYVAGEVNPAISELLKVESSLSTLREVNYMVISDMFLEE